MPATVVLLLAAAVMAPQSGPAVRSAPKTNVRTGTLTSVDAATRTVTLRLTGGGADTFAWADTTLVLSDRRRAAVDALRQGAAVVVRFRRSKTTPYRLYDLMDRASWTWMDRIRHRLTEVTVRSADADALVATEGADAAPIEYRVTPKTRWLLDGKEAGPSGVRVGERVWVVPRMLPSGGVMAAGVARTEGEARRLQEESRPTVSGSVVSVDAGRGTVRLRTRAGDDRSLVLSPGCTVTSGGKSMPVGSLRVGVTVTAHLRRDSTGERVVTRIVVQGTRSIGEPGTRSIGKPGGTRSIGKPGGTRSIGGK